MAPHRVGITYVNNLAGSRALLLAGGMRYNNGHQVKCISYYDLDKRSYRSLESFDKEFFRPLMVTLNGGPVMMPGQLSGKVYFT